jgi:hypothetical protein
MRTVNFMVCGSAGALDFQYACVRASWSALLPAIFVFILCMRYISAPAPIQKALDVAKASFEPYITLEEAEALDATASVGENILEGDDETVITHVATPVPLWRTLVLSWLALIETLVWLGIGSFSWVNNPSDSWSVVVPVLISCTWLYATMRPVLSPMPTPRWDLFVLYLIHLATAILLFGGMVFDHDAAGLPLPHFLVIAALAGNLLVTMVLLTVIINIPLALPSKRVRKEDIVSTHQ